MFWSLVSAFNELGLTLAVRLSLMPYSWLLCFHMGILHEPIHLILIDLSDEIHESLRECSFETLRFQIGLSVILSLNVIENGDDLRIALMLCEGTRGVMERGLLQ